MATHLDVLAERVPDVLTTYRALATATAARAVEDGRLRADLAAPLLDLLATSDRPGQES